MNKVMVYYWCPDETLGILEMTCVAKRLDYFQWLRKLQGNLTLDRKDIMFLWNRFSITIF
ncbi:MAG TPA: hypothetical protein DGN60_00060 [Chloroflexi bacterium]|nr:hypothetical protein [Chloroflexota bacterium]